jgi:hypothetical protein
MGDESQPQVGKDLVTYAEASRRFAESHLGQQDWSGLPVPVAGLQLVLEPRYKHKALSEFRWKECYDENGVRHAIEEEPPPKPSEFKIVNSWWNESIR